MHFVPIVNESGKEDSVISNLKNIPIITNALGTFGSYDIITKLESSDEQNIQNVISNKIRKINFPENKQVIVKKKFII